MILPIQVQVVRGMIKNKCSDLEIKEYIDRIQDFNDSKVSFCNKKPKVRKWIVTIHEE